MNTSLITTSEVGLSDRLAGMLERLRGIAGDDWLESIVYGRASRDRKKLMRSIDDQLVDCVGWLEPIRWNPTVIVRDSDRSASQWRKQEREGFDEAMALIESGRYGGFATWEPSRAGRDLEIYSMGFEFLRAEADANTMRERQLRTVRLNAEKGRPHGRLPYGYRRVYDENTGVLLRQEPDPHTGRIVREMARDVRDGKSMWSIAMRLQEAGEPTPKRTRTDAPRGWETKTIQQVLRNPTIAGKRVYRGEVIGDAQWEVLVSWEDFQKIQRIFSDPARRIKGGGGQPAKSLTVMIARCHYCGRGVRRVIERRPGRKHTVRYQCQYKGCYKVTIAAEPLDLFVEETVLAWFERSENLARLTGGDDAAWLERASEAEEEIAALKTRLEDAAGQYAAGSLSMGMLTTIEQTLRPQIENAERALIPPIEDENARALATSGDVRATCAGMPLAVRRKLLKAMFDIRITQAKSPGQNAFDETRVHIEPRTR